MIFSLVLSIIGAKVALRKHKDIVGFFNRSIPSLKGAVKPAAVKSLALSDRLYSKNKFPNFVLEELQKLADSSDNLKRAKVTKYLQEIQQKNNNCL